MITKLHTEDIDLLKLIVKPNIYVITKEGLGKVISVQDNEIEVLNSEKKVSIFTFQEIIPIMKGFEHLTFLDLFTVVDIITDRKSYATYKPNHNFIPHFYEITEESIDLKVQIFHNFDILHCDNMITNLGAVYHFLLSKNYDVYNLHRRGLVIIDPSYYETNSIQ